MDLGRRVVVIGGGFVAFDAARTALRAGRERREPARPSWPKRTRASRKRSIRRARRFAAAPPKSRSCRSRTSTRCRCCEPRRATRSSRRPQTEGVRFITRRGPKQLLGNGHRLERVELRRRRSVFDETGRFAPGYDDGDVDLARGRRLHSRDRPEGGPVLPHSRRTASRCTPAGRSGSIRRRWPRRRPGSMPAATSPSARAT